MLIEKLTKENIAQLKELYQHFVAVAQSDFLFEIPPLSFPDFQQNFDNTYIKGYYNSDGFLLYSDNLTFAIEITVLFTKNPNDLNAKMKLLTHFLTEVKKRYANKTISYPMLGTQNNLTTEIIKLGFHPIGEAILEFNFHNIISQVLLQKCVIPTISAPYSIDFWQNIYVNDAIKTIHTEFQNTNDAKFDPRFKTTVGVQTIIESIISGYYGNFNPKYVSVLKYKHLPVGYCFVNFTTQNTANIPLLVINKEHQNKGFAKALLLNSINALNKDKNQDEIQVDLLNVTCDTDNHNAIKTYRKTGFKEKTYYTHAYMEI